MNRKLFMRRMLMLKFGVAFMVFVLFALLVKLQILRWIHILFGYLFLLFAFGTIYNRFRNKSIRSIYFIISVPFCVLYGILTFVMPVLLLFGNLIIYFLIVILIPCIVYELNQKINLFDIEITTYLFVAISASSISSVMFYRYIWKLCNRLSPFGPEVSPQLKRFRIKELMEYVLTPQHIRFIIYLAYLIYLVVFSFNTLQHNSIFATSEIDFAIMQSFLVFLAFDSLRVNVKSVNLSVGDLFVKMMHGFIKEDDKK